MRASTQLAAEYSRSRKRGNEYRVTILMGCATSLSCVPLLLREVTRQLAGERRREADERLGVPNVDVGYECLGR